MLFRSRRFLPEANMFRRNKKSFKKNETVEKGPPELRTGVEIFDEIVKLGLMRVTEVGATTIIREYQGHVVGRK